jgi:heat shock protein HslJ
MKLRFITSLSIIALALFATGCDREAAAPVPVEAASDVATPLDSELAGTRWQLISIQSMNDTKDVPDDPSKYTLAFGADGTAALLADCNRGTGTYTSTQPGQLNFGAIATTRMACPPGSIGDVYVAQFEWVRSYVIEGDNLYLATMADGSIIGFEPAPSGTGQAPLGN